MILLSYDRPHNLEKSLPILNKYKYIDEILVFHGHPDYYREFTYDKVVNYEDYELNKKYGASRRWFHSQRAKNDIIIIMDDDALPSEKLVNDCLYALLNNKNTIYGNHKRLCNKEGYKNNTSDYNVILTKFFPGIL